MENGIKTNHVRFYSLATIYIINTTIFNERVIFSFRGYKGDDYFIAGCSIEHPDIPKDKKIVRAWNGPGGQMVRPIPNEPDKCELIWLMDCEYNGWIPSSILEIAMPFAQTQFVDCARELAKTL